MKKNKRNNAISNNLKALDRRMVLIDIENAIGKDRLNENDVQALKQDLYKSGAINQDDMIVVGTSHSQNYIAAQFAWAGPRHVFQKGHDGADYALLKVLQENISDRFAEVVMISGDGIFSKTLKSLQREGVKITVMAQLKSLSKKLIPASSLVVGLPTMTTNTNSHFAHSKAA